MTRDPRVISLTYILAPSDRVEFVQPLDEVAPLGTPDKLKRLKASELLKIEKGVLKKWAELSTNRGVGTERRKATGAQRPFTQQEASWLLDVMRRAALQVGRYKAGAPLAPLRMSDLPPL
jgi:hypothetical protein